MKTKLLFTYILQTSFGKYREKDVIVKVSFNIVLTIFNIEADYYKVLAT